MVERFYPLVRDSAALLKSYILGIADNPLSEVAALLLFVSTYISVKLLVSRLLERSSKRLQLSAELASLLGVYAALSYLYTRFLNVEVFEVILVFLYFAVVRTLFRFLDEFISFGSISSWVFNVSLLVNTLALFLQDISRGMAELEGFYSFLFKLSAAIMLSSLLPSFYSLTLSSVENEFLKRVFRRASPALLLLYAAVILAWVLGTVRISQDFVIKVAALTGVLIAYFFFQVYLVSNLEKQLGADSQILKPSLRRFMGLLSIFILYRGTDLLFDLGAVKSLLSGVHLIDTEFVKISLLSLLESIYLFLLLLALTHLLKNSLYLYFYRKGMEVEAGSFRALTSNLGIFLAVVIALVHLGITWKVLVPLAGALGIGLGFGLQTIFNNYVSGFILLLSKNIKVGDLVELEGSAGRAIGRSGETIFGKVVNINILTTVVRTNDNFEIAIPNSEFVSGRIVNYSLSDPNVRVRIPFGVSYHSDPKKVEEVLLRVASNVNEVLKDPPPKVWFYEMADSALIFYLLVWVDIRKFWRMRALRSEIYFRAWEELKKEGIEIPFPQRDVWFKNPLKVEIDERSLHGRGDGGGEEGG